MADPRHIPAIDRLLLRPGVASLEGVHGRRAVVEALRASADAVRERIRSGVELDDIGTAVEAEAAARLRLEFRPSLRAVINATGVIVHTNLGRAPLADAAVRRVAEIARGYSNLEYDLEAGSRGRRDLHAERLLCRLTGAAAACVVNNNAAATLITLAALAAGREAIVSRGELVEIGGGFRIPEVMSQSGAVLREVGTTNRTRVGDYAAAISDRTAVILRVHPSNFRIEGFTERPSLRELVDLGRRFNVPVLDDLGSGYLPRRDGTADRLAALRGEPAISAAIEDGATAVMFSGDKLLGGPQAGIVAGDRVAIDRVRRHPLMRALRVDKMTYAALEATLFAYMADDLDAVPVAGMMSASPESIRGRAEALATALTGTGLECAIVEGRSAIGGGSAPGATLPTFLLRLQRRGTGANDLEAKLRRLDPPVIGRIEDGHAVLDLRTVLPWQDALLRDLLKTLTAAG